LVISPFARKVCAAMSCAVGVVDGSDARAWSSDRRSALVASGVDGESYFALTPMAFVPVDE